MKSSMTRLCLVLAGLTLAMVRTEAATVTANVTIDLNVAITGNSWTGVGHPLDQMVQVSSGDTVTINIDFLGNQALLWSSNGYFSPWLLLGNFPNGSFTQSQDGTFSWSNLSVSLLGLTQGTQFPAGQLTDGSSGSIHLGPTARLGNDYVMRTFSGASLSFLATWSDGDPFREYGTIGFSPRQSLFDGTVGITQATPQLPVPDAGSLLAPLALVLVGMIALQRRSGRR
ncbi:MAG TPA: hypothetical protein PKX00_21165 [Opitutaceae bacterium]|nr:hypothetical protein [Opitutaceae bacterium]